MFLQKQWAINCVLSITFVKSFGYGTVENSAANINKKNKTTYIKNTPYLLNKSNMVDGRIFVSLHLFHLGPIPHTDPHDTFLLISIY